MGRIRRIHDNDEADMKLTINQKAIQPPFLSSRVLTSAHREDSWHNKHKQGLYSGASFWNGAVRALFLTKIVVEERRVDGIHLSKLLPILRAWHHAFSSSYCSHSV